MCWEMCLTANVCVEDLDKKNRHIVFWPRPRPTNNVYVIGNGYATFQSLILITSMKGIFWWNVTLGLAFQVNVIFILVGV